MDEYVIVLAITAGLTQFVKEQFCLEGKKVTRLSFAMGAVLFVVFNLHQFFPGVTVYIEYAVKALTAGLSASGYYKLARQFTTAKPDPGDQLAG